MKAPTMDEMIAQCEQQKKPGEMIAFAIGVGRIAPKLGMIRKMKEALLLVKSCEGFIGIHTIDLWHNLLIYDTLNNAKGAKNTLKYKGCEVGNIVPILIQKKYIDEAKGA